MNPGSVVPLSQEPAWGEPDWGVLEETGSAPKFPAELLGSFWESWVQDRARATASPVDFVACALLASAASVIGNARWPQAGAAWSEPPALWLAVVAPPSAGKSPALGEVQRLVRAAEEVLCEGFAERQQDHDATALAAKERHKVWEAEVKAAVDAGAGPPQRPSDTYPPAPLQRPRIVANDATPEALAKLLSALPRGLLSWHDELAAWASFNKYNTAGAGRQFWLEAYGGRPYTVDRRSTPDPLQINRLTIGVLGGVQPDRLRELLHGGDDGLWARFLWCMPSNVPNFTIARKADDQTEAKEAFQRLARLTMGGDCEGTATPVSVRLSDAATASLERFEAQCRDEAKRLPGLASTLGKARGHALRLTAVVAYLRWCAKAGALEPLTLIEDDTKRAIALVHAYFLPMAARALGGDSLSREERDAQDLANWVMAKGLQIFNVREARRSITGGLRGAARMNKACKVLQRAGFLRERFSRAGSTAGRQRRDYSVHPALLGDSQ